MRYFILTIMIIFCIGCTDNNRDDGAFPETFTVEETPSDSSMSLNEESGVKDILRARLKKLSDLNTAIVNKRDGVKELQSVYRNEIVTLKREIATLQQTNKLSGFESAIKQPRIRNNLVLIQKKLAYLERLNQVSRRLIFGSEELLFMQRDTQTDLKLVDVIDEQEINDLITQIEEVIEKYLPDAGKLIIRSDDLDLKPVKEIWQEIMSAKPDETLEVTESQLTLLSANTPSDRTSAINRIREGVFDYNWYQHEENGVFAVRPKEFMEAEGHKKGTVRQAPKPDLFSMNIEKIICAYPYTIVGVLFRGTKYDYEKIIQIEGGRMAISFNGDSWLTSFVAGCERAYYSHAARNRNLVSQKTRRGDAGSLTTEHIVVPIRKKAFTRVIFVFPHQDPESLTSKLNTFQIRGDEFIQFRIK